ELDPAFAAGLKDVRLLVTSSLPLAAAACTAYMAGACKKAARQVIEKQWDPYRIAFEQAPWLYQHAERPFQTKAPEEQRCAGKAFGSKVQNGAAADQQRRRLHFVLQI